MISRKYLLVLICMLGAWFIFHLFQDETLHPDAAKAIAYYNTEPDYEQNILIGLIGLKNIENHNPMRHGQEIYSQLLLDRDYQNDIAIYPSIEALPEFDAYEFFCIYSEDVCVSAVENNQTNIDNLLDQFAPVLLQYFALSSLEHHSKRNAGFTDIDRIQLGFSQFKTLSQLITLHIYTDTIKGNVRLAAKNFERHLTIQRKLMQPSNEDSIGIHHIVNASTEYPFLIKTLKKVGFKDWGNISHQLRPLSIEELSSDALFTLPFAQYTRLFATDKITGVDHVNQGQYSVLMPFYKKNMTLNQIYKHTKMNSLPLNIQKHEALHFVANKKIKLDAFYEQQKNDLENLFLFGIKNYKNWVGAILITVSTPRFVELQRDFFTLDLNFNLLKLLMLDSQTELKQALDSEAFANPYTGEKPWMKDEKICYTWPDEDVCVSLN